MNNLRAIEESSIIEDKGANDKESFTLPGMIIAICCLLANTVGFLVFFFNKSRKKFDALIPNLIMFAFFFSGWINFNSIVTGCFSFFFTNNPLPHILSKPYIFSWLTDSLQVCTKIINAGLYTIFVPTSLLMEVLYCFESIHLFKNPVSSTKIRKIVYIAIISIVMIFYLTVFVFKTVMGDALKDEKQTMTSYWTEDRYRITINGYLHWLWAITFPYMLLALFSLGLIFQSIKTQTVLYLQDKNVFKKRHLLYVTINCICLLEPTIYSFSYWLGKPINKLGDFLSADLTYILINSNGLFTGIPRILEVDVFSFLTGKKKKVERTLVLPNAASENISLSSESVEINSEVNKINEPLLPDVSKTSIKGKKELDLRSVVYNDETYAQAPLSSKITMNSLTEGVYYTLKCILHSAKRTTEGISIIKDDTYNYVNEHTFRLGGHKINKIETKQKTEIKQKNWLKRFSLLFSTRIKVTEYAPELFANLKKLDQYNEEKMKESFDDLKNAENLNKCMGSEGKSGSVFFFTHDKKFILKTISEAELDSLVHKLLKPYYELIVGKNNTYLTRLYGAYTLKMGRSEMHLILMENLAPFPDSAFVFKYDLKGSLIGRKTKKIFSKKKKTLKDQDYLDICDKERKAKVLLSENDVEVIQNEIKDDLKILAKAQLIDYSMFIVVAERKKIDPKKLLGNRMFNSAINKKYVYLLGIIDYLTFFGFNKQLEYVIKTMGNKKKEVSCVHPKRYRDRFYNFMFKHVLISEKDEEPEEEIQL